MKCIRVLILTLVFTFMGLSSIKAQNEQYGLWLSFKVDKNYGKLSLGAESELRTVYILRLIDRGSISLEAKYDIMKRLKVGLSYTLMNALDVKYRNYQLRNRFTTALEYKIKFGNFRLVIDQKLRTTLKDEQKRIREDGSLDTYSDNPEWTWVNGVEINYNIPKSKLNPFLSAQTYYTLNTGETDRLKNTRLKGGLMYKRNKRQSFKGYFLYNTNQESDDNFGKFIGGISFDVAIK